MKQVQHFNKNLWRKLKIEFISWLLNCRNECTSYEANSDKRRSVDSEERSDYPIPIKSNGRSEHDLQLALHLELGPELELDLGPKISETFDHKLPSSDTSENEQKTDNCSRWLV